MKRIFTFAIALMSLFSIASAANVTFTVTVPNPTYQCWIVGSFNGWNNNDKQMTKVDDTHFTITMDDATWAAGVTTANVQYKYCSGGGDWAYVEKYADGSEIHANRVYTGTNTWTDTNHVLPDETQVGTNGVDVVAKWATVYNPNVLPVPMNVKIDVLVPAGTIQCYIVGTFNNWAGPTAPVDSCKMALISTNTDGTMIFEKTIFSADVNKLAYHFCSGPDWSYEQLAPTGDYKYPEVNPVVTSWKKVFDPANVGTIVVTITVPAGTAEVWAVGSFQGWSMDNALACTKNADGTFSFTVNFTGGFEYKLYNKKDNSWGYNAVDALGADIPNTIVNYPADVDSHVTVVAWKQNLSAISEVKAAKNLIYCNNSSIVVEGVTNDVTVLDLAGRTVQSSNMVGTFTSKSLNAGLYIVRVDGATRKVAVK
ncbi:MAG: hypothetical protein WC542_02740 [Paludibacter sp.]|jgi:hypothetical protein